MTWLYSIILCISVYQCIAYSKTNKHVELKNKEAITLDVEPMNYGADKHYLEEGTHKKISCKGSHKFQKIEWYDPAGELVKHEPAGRVFVQEHFVPSAKSKPQAILVVTRALVKDSGVWTCQSGDVKETVPLCVLEVAEFVATPEDVTIDEGRSITLSCQARGDPEPKIQWYRNGELLSDDDHKVYTSTKYNHHGFEGLLTIKSVTPEDSGSYVCEAVQEIPEVDCGSTDSVNITLNVNHAPKFSQDVKTTYLFATNNESIELICAPSAYPAPTFRWFRELGDSNMLTEYSDKQFKVSDDDTQSVLSLVANSSTFDKKFRCQVDNEYGQAVHHFQILRMLKPAKINELTVVNATGHSIEFNTTWNDSDFFPIDGFNIEYFEKKASGSPREYHWRQAKKAYFEPALNFEVDEDIIVPVTNLKAETEYWVRMRAVNDLGDAPWSAPVLASTSPEVEDVEDLVTATADGEQQVSIAEPSDMLGILSGIFITIGIVIVAALCILIVQRV